MTATAEKTAATGGQDSPKAGVVPSFTVTLNLSAASPALISATATNAAGLSATSAITVQ